MLADIVTVIGETATLRLVQSFGGREIHVPIRQQGRTWDALVEAIGHESAAAFCRHYAGETLYIASSVKMHTEYNRQKASRMRAEGRSWAEIARSMTRPQGYTERGARKLLEKHPSSTLSLFPEDVPP